MKTQAKITEYDQRAIDFLESTGTSLDIVYLYTGTYFPNDTDDRDIYQFTLTNARGSYSSKFGDSLNNTKIRELKTVKRRCDYKQDYDFCKRNGIKVSQSGHVLHSRKPSKPGAYDILACMDSYYPYTFEEFCSDYGYSDQPLTEYDSVMHTFLAVREQSKGLRAMFSDSELDQLAEIV